jgi:hypothetical protein
VFSEENKGGVTEWPFPGIRIGYEQTESPEVTARKLRAITVLSDKLEKVHEKETGMFVYA